MRGSVARPLQLPSTMNSNNALKVLGAALALAVSLSVVGCVHKQEGPMERAGKKIDQAADKTKNTTEKVADDVKDGAKK